LAEIRRPFRSLYDPVPPFNLTSENTALLILDVQRLTVHESGGLARLALKKGIFSEFNDYFKSVRKMIPNIILLVDRCRELGIQIIFTRLASSSKNGRDMSAQNKVLGDILIHESEDSRFIETLHPERGDIVIQKVCNNPFNCTGLEEILRNLGVEYLIVCGVRSPGYLNTTALDAADRGFGVIVVSDACAGGVCRGTQHLTGGLIRVRPTRSVMEVLLDLEGDVK